MQPWQKIRARRYCAPAEGAEPGLINFKEVATFIGGDKEVHTENFDVFSNFDPNAWLL